ncbi:hypothetical protein [Bifidobacterium callimiconis]|uniref:hypothetical protein n=1 Tax=Bifidobacterium callimiconis TaxID=2306973 RepID=UPI0013DEE48F|nr:hypothetical protein [Bifidobacterium callimiconis]
MRRPQQVWLSAGILILLIFLILLNLDKTKRETERGEVDFAVPFLREYLRRAAA